MPKYCRSDGSCTEWEMPHVGIPGTNFLTLPELYEKYRLGICWFYYDIGLSEAEKVCHTSLKERLTREAYQELVYKAITHHWFVCRYLEEHPNAAKRYLARKVGWMYYDILDRAEKEYAQDLH